MNKYYLDLHVHIGRSGDGLPVKITASRDLTLEKILYECRERKGLDIVGVVDCASPGVLADLKNLLYRGELVELSQGGFRYQGSLTLLAGVEMEAREPWGRSAHYLAFFPTLALLESFAAFIGQRIKNPQLSTQACYLQASHLLEAVIGHGGIFIPAHIFTPHKGLFGSCAATLKEIFGLKAAEITAFELGLSADSQMAMWLPELREGNFFSNSDAHSLEKIGREYNQVLLAQPTFAELENLIYKRGEQRITANYGLNPRLGKYHRSYCNGCGRAFLEEEAVLACPFCKTGEFVTGVLDRILSIGSGESQEPICPYHYQIPLMFLPGLGKKTLDRLLVRFGTEMRVLHDASLEELTDTVGPNHASMILQARRGLLECQPGAGGIYGRICTDHSL